MSVLIKGIEMPKNCFECPWRCKVDPENLLCRISGEYFEETFSSTIQNRHKSCPLVPVPPHGRLIDADALMEEFRLPKDLLDPAQVLMHITGVRVAIQTAPTIIPAEEASECLNASTI